ncbi:ATP/GTP-binding protein [Microcoleus sp. herbarium8]|uniref:AAA family ATPase n=1 Tax=Microcoleus sp. herbarium8 TaxID=3055436 RepID=UPI002FD21822
MLIQLTIQNFLSFRDEVTFSMVGVNSDRQHIDHLAEDAAGKGRSILPIAAIYGANAAGKSNLIEAISFAKNLVVQGTRSSQTIPVSSFKLGDYSKQPSKFEFIFTHQGEQYSYGFKLNREQIFEEWLYGIPNGKKQEIMYFERVTSSQKQTKVEYGSKLKGRSKKRQQFLDFIAEGTRPNQLFLTESLERNVVILKPIFDWFRKVLTIIPAEADYTGLEIGVLSDESFTDFLSEFLKFAGTGIDSIITDEVELDFDRHFPTMPKVLRDNIIQELNEAEKNSIAMIENLGGGRFLLFKDDENQVSLIQLRTRHRSEDGDFFDFSIEEESEGTQRLINLIPALFILKQEEEKVIFLDELDRRLHPLLSRIFVQVAINCKDKNNQLIFTTHDTNLLDLDLLRRDEIWFVEKCEKGVSNLYSLAEFKMKPDLKIEKGYLNGRFGAIPFFGNPQSLGWLNCETDLSVITK